MRRAGAARRLAGWIAALALATALAGCGAATPPPTPTPATIAVSAELADLAADLERLAPGLVRAQRSSYGAALEAVSTGFADAALVWGMPPAVGEGFVVEIVGADGLAIVVNPRNRLGPVEMETVRDLFTGRVQNWAELGQADVAVEVVTRERGAGPREALEQLVLGAGEITVNAVVAASDGAVLDYVAAEPGAIGYVAAASLREGVRALTVDGERPEPQVVRQGLYDLMAGVWLVYRPGSVGDRLGALLASDAGQDALYRCCAAAELAHDLLARGSEG